jgi:spore maturation protein CgeB
VRPVPAPPTVMLLTPADSPNLLGSYARAFRKLGCPVDTWDFEPVQARAARLGPVGRRFHQFVPVEPWTKRANRGLVMAVRQRAPDVLGVVCSESVTAGALAQVRASAPSTRLVLFWPDPMQNLGVHTVQALPMYDLVATYARSSVEPMLHLGARRVEWVPFAADPDLFGGDEADASRHTDYDCDVGFIANTRPEREEAVLTLLGAGINVRVWGTREWVTSTKDRTAATRYWQGRPLFGAELGQATRTFGLALNVIDPTNYPAANMRIFETLAAGGTLLSTPCPEVADQFPDGVAAFYFESTGQLVTRALELRRNEPYRRDVAREGRRRVLAEHTYVHRALQVLRALGLPAPE